MTETCAGSIYSTVFPQVDAGREFASVGTPIPGMHIRIVDEHGALAGPGEPGELQVRGTMIFTQYYNNETATHSAFTADGWFQTGDLGCIDEGRLTLVGRSKDSIIVSGVNYFSHELEAVLEQLEGIERSHVAVFPTRPKGADTEQLVIAFATSMPLDDEKLYQRLIAIRSTTIMMWGFRPSLILPLPKQAFPKTSLGKTQRSLMRKRLESSGFAEEVATVSALIGRQLGGYVAPEGAAEAAVTAIYADVFGLDPGGMGATANFFDLGGTSLDIFKLKQRLEKHFGIADVPIVMLLQNPTARALAKRLAPGSAGEVDRYDPVVPLQLAGGKLPFFCVHPGIGEVLVFVNLAKYFVNERPFYALRARGFRNDEPYFASFDEMAMAYVNAIRERQPAGPYVLAGYSLGAPIAVEIARILESQGERVAFIACIDGPPCRVIGGLDEIDIAVSLAFFLSLIEKKDLLILPTRYRVSGEDFCANLVQNAPASRLAELNLDLPGFRRWAALSHALNALGATHMESTDCKLVDSVTAFHAEPLRFTPEDWRNRIYAWDECTRQPNRYIEVDGDHASLLGPKHVGTFQALLRAEIDRATGGR
jgi:thioesterase domain-containing protein/acyl carrier protein